MRRPPRGLSADEAALWARVAGSVTPLKGRRALHRPSPATAAVADVPPPPKPAAAPAKVKGRIPPPPRAPILPAAPPRALDHQGLDSSWDRKLGKGTVLPDFTLDLHGATLDAAHARLDHGLMQAQAHGARVVLLITGRPRPQDDHGIAAAGGRGERRGAIRAKVLDWLAAGPHADRIAAVRPAHPRHGGAGAVYIVLKRPR